MRKIICAPENLIPQVIEKDVKYFSTYTNPRRDDVGYYAPTLINDVQREGISPSNKVWDFATIALATAAADNSLSRKMSADGWTREIDLTIHLVDPDEWIPIKEDLEKTLKFLTGDFWYLTFKCGGVKPPVVEKKKQINANCVSLLSGGLDSLVGAIDLTANNNRPLLVSQIVKGDAETQRYYAKIINPIGVHFQWSHKLHLPTGESEGSTRGRSLVFFAFAAIAADAISVHQDSPVQIFVPENGFISLNVPLNPGRMGSFSTKTTHPVYIAGIQKIWDMLDLNFQLVTPYQFKTKGELMLECKNKFLLKQLACTSTSCGKYARYGHQHCGRCIPCLVRRAAFLRSGIIDKTTKGYRFSVLTSAGKDRGPNDVGAIARACLMIKHSNIEDLISSNLSFAGGQKRMDLEDVIFRGFKEIEVLLSEQGVL